MFKVILVSATAALFAVSQVSASQLSVPNGHQSIGEIFKPDVFKNCVKGKKCGKSCIPRKNNCTK